MKKDVPVDFVEVWLKGEERAVVGGGNNAASATRSIVNLRARLMETGELKKGERSFRCRFQIPEDAPPSYRTFQSGIAYRLEAHASIPWWPDAKNSWVLDVAPRATRGAPSPYVFASAEGPAGADPYVEASLADQVVAPGDVVDGRVALYNVEVGRFHGVKIAFVGRQTTRAGKRQATIDVQRFELTLPIDGMRDGDAIPFRTRAPEMSPTFRSQLVRLDWVLIVSGMRRLARDVRAEAPLLVLPASAPAPTERRLAPPAVGTPRLNEVWARVAGEIGMELSDDVLQARIGDVIAIVQQELRPGRGVYLVGRVRYPTLGLALDGGVLHGFQRFVGSANRVSTGEHYFVGRDKQQVEAFVDALGLAQVTASIADISDDELILEQGKATQRFADIRAFASLTLSLARRWTEAVKAIPPPECFDPSQVATWRSLADALGTTLATASMSAAGSFEGRTAELATRFAADGAPLSTAVTLRMEPPLLVKPMHWNADDGGSIEVSGADAIIKALTESCLALEVEAEALSASLAAPLASDQAALELLGALVDFEIALRTQRSGYR
jgi:hypothetical protein